MDWCGARVDSGESERARADVAERDQFAPSETSNAIVGAFYSAEHLPDVGASSFPKLLIPRVPVITVFKKKALGIVAVGTQPCFRFQCYIELLDSSIPAACLSILDHRCIVYLNDVRGETKAQRLVRLEAADLCACNYAQPGGHWMRTLNGPVQFLQLPYRKNFSPRISCPTS